MDLIISFEVADQINIMRRGEFSGMGPSSEGTEFKFDPKAGVGVFSWANGNRGQYNPPTAMKPES